ncbi:MAG: ATP-grasp domain-containing protein [Planctomycetes bacterium]|nr:ATP-grasp domain-containing protein [Planctomycetota bacterium]
MAFTKLLVANRGEIAARVLRSARALGYPTVAVYSDADAASPHVRLADEAVRIGPAPAGESYLKGEALLEAAARTGADAVHPGYGFLSENAAFAAACAWAGLVFVGPPVEAIEVMGDKARAKARMRDAGVPVVPGHEGDAQDEAALREAAERVGYPLLIKAAAGGGGRGMRRVERPADLPRALASARDEAAAAFGDGRVLLERLVVGARHVEVQVLADAHGAAVHLFERDCSTQRRYQKVLEECPSPAVDPDLRARMGAAAVAAARAVGYQGAGTVEFLLDRDGAFYFLEMNTRLQVEHPVTEMVTGLDLVALQLDVAAGRPLPFRQEDLRLTGHAIEARLYAEDPWAGHVPQTGRVLAFEPAAGDGLRCDHALASGLEVTPFYDPMVAKVVAHGRDREEARRRLRRALLDTVLLGPRTNRRFLLDVLGHPTFVEGGVTTGFLEELEPLARPAPGPRALAAAAALWALPPAPGRERGDGWRSAGSRERPLSLLVDDRPLAGDVAVTGEGACRVRLDGAAPAVVRVLAREGARARVDVDGVQETVHVARDGERLLVEVGGARLTLAPAPVGAVGGPGAAGDGTVRAPMSGRVVAVEVTPGARVARGQVAARVESMKIESPVVCDVAGEVAEVRVSAGAQVEAGQALVVITPEGQG